MGQVDLGSMLIGTGYGTNISGSSRSVSSTKSSEAFDKTFDRARDSSRTKDSSSSTKSTSRRDDLGQQVKQDEKAYKNKEVKDKDSTQVAQKADYTSKEVESETNIEVQDESDESKSQKIDDQILALVSQALNVSVDEIKEVLGQLGLETKDLMSQEGFSTFIGEICGQGSVTDLLMNAGDIKGITTLFEDLSALNEHAQALGTQNTTEQTIVESMQQPVFAESSAKNSLKTENEQNPISVMKTGEIDQTILNEEAAVATVKITDRYSENAETSDQNLSFLQGQEEQTEGIGINVPVHNFTTTASTKFFETQAGTVGQTTTTKLTENGKAFIEQIDFKVIGQTRELNVQLSPKELGNLNIKIIENNGALVAEIKVDNDKAKEFMLNEIHLLKENLEKQGLNITDVKVDIRQDNHQSQMEQERQKSSKRIQEIISKHFAESEEEEEESIPIVGESEVDYMI